MQMQRRRCEPDLGAVTLTTGARLALGRAGEVEHGYVGRFASGDYGDVPGEVVALNDAASFPDAVGAMLGMYRTGPGEHLVVDTIGRGTARRTTVSVPAGWAPHGGPATVVVREHRAALAWPVWVLCPEGYERRLDNGKTAAPAWWQIEELAGHTVPALALVWRDVGKGDAPILRRVLVYSGEPADGRELVGCQLVGDRVGDHAVVP